ncbi:MAG: glycosyltransferase family 2 protein [Bacteroidetes bacterium]|nr:glycosyltransferase family 2 protein [Bacteroidota bacterium]
MPKVSIVIPCFNSEQHLEGTLAELKELRQSILRKNMELQYVFVNDGSNDNTLQHLLSFKKLYPAEVTVVDLTGNFGSYNAFLAGCSVSTGDCCVQLHDDLQDPPEHIPRMIDFWLSGAKYVIAQRVKREEPLLHQLLSKFYHLLMRKVALPNVPEGGFDLILFDKVLLQHLLGMNETNTNLVYLISWMQYPYVTIPITRTIIKSPSRWNFIKRVKLVIDSLVSFSYLPIQLVTLLAIFTLFCFVAVSVMWYMRRCGFFIWLLSLQSSIIMFSLSVLAEYLYRTHRATLNRPPFIINQTY